MKVEFTKLEGLANDFVLVDARSNPSIRDLVRPLVPRIANRKTGIGCDGVLFLLSGSHKEYLMLLTNADGSEAEMCGNGLRCIGHYLRITGIKSAECHIETPSGDRTVEFTGIEGGMPMYRVNMGAPILSSALIPTTLGGETCIEAELATPTGTKKFTCVSMGNPHAVTFVSDPAAIDINIDGSAIERHPAFPRRTNVEFAKVLAPGMATARIWERGAGETSACGTGACAIAVAARLTGRIDGSLEISLPGGKLLIEWDGGSAPVFMTGTAKSVFSGTFDTAAFE